MTSQVTAILNQLFDEGDAASPACQSTEAVLAALAEAVLNGVDPASVDAAAWSHAQSCDRCHLAYQELLAILRAEREGSLEAPPTAAQFDFSYLAAPADAQKTAAAAAHPDWWLDEAGRLIIRYMAALSARLQALTFQQPALQPLYLKSPGGPAGPPLVIRADHIIATVRIDSTTRDPEHCMLELEVEIPSRGGWPNLAGISVALMRGAAEVIAAQETDAFGKALFAAVPITDLPDLSIAITVA